MTSRLLLSSKSQRSFCNVMLKGCGTSSSSRFRALKERDYCYCYMNTNRNSITHLHQQQQQQQSHYHSLASYCNIRTNENHHLSVPVSSPLSSSLYPLHRLDQTRQMGRKDGHSAFYKPRKPSRKQLKKYHKRKREEYQHKIGRHSKPGSLAGPRREEEELERQNLVALGSGKIKRGLLPEYAEYNYGDALIDDLFGNSAGDTSAPTPKPLNMGRQYNKYYSLVSGLMENYNAQLALAPTPGNENKNDDGDELNENPDKAIAAPLPTDKQISLLLRSYRDKYSSRTKRLGITKALRHLVAEMKIPTQLFGERTYSALMYCAASPTEARRIMQMMVENGFSPDEYSYSILVDIYAKRGDFRGAAKVLSEMKFDGGVEPTLAAYTSLLAACYKVINTPSMPQGIKSEAGTLAWDKWKELVTNGLEPDVMAYGAIIRIMAARGFPERAINIIEEMQTKDVMPTTLIFTAALQAVSRSHANILRFQGGYSTKNKRREHITAHHGKMARHIVILAEQAEVEQDDGFVSALMICAGTAGDSATAKAIYLASEVRKLQHLRLIGGPEHLRQIRGESINDPVDDVLAIETSVKDLSISDGTSGNNEGSIGNEMNELLSKDDKDVEFHESGKSNEMKPRKKRNRNDTRKLSALLRASANAAQRRGLGDMWKGFENKGFLCENSLRLINARYQPKYVDKSLPGLSGTESGLSSMVWDDDDDAHLMGKRLRRKKFMGLLEDTEDNTLEDLDPSLYPIFDVDSEVDEVDEDGNGSDKSDESTFQVNGTEVVDMPTSSSEEKQNRISPQKSNYIQQSVNKNSDPSDDEVLFSEVDSIFSDDADENILDLESLQSEEGGTNLQPKSSVGEDKMPDPIEENRVTAIPDTEFSVGEIKIDEYKDELDIILYGMPQSRIKKVRKEFKSTLGDPSMLRLVPMLRENMPDIIEPKWLKEKNVRDARFVMDKAKDDGIVDTHLMYSMLQVLARSENIEEALAFHEEQYALYDMKPSPDSDRTIIQMLVKANEITRALDFKESTEKRGRHLDILSYGSIIEYFGNNNQIGSALAMIKECRKVHGSPPAERSLEQLRIKCRQQGIEETVGLVELIGEDPREWVKEGEHKYKREYSKKNKHLVQMHHDLSVRI